MKPYFSILMITVMTSLLSQSQISIMSFNLRYDNASDNENSWSKRKDAVVNLIESYNPSILGVQEGLHHQIEYINSSLNAYNYVGVGRDNGKTKGEYTAIFYDKRRFEVVNTKTYWLSETPNEVSVGWDASMERITTFAELVDKKTKFHFFVFNCHFDHVGEKARNRSAELLLKLIKDKNLENEKIIIMGDLNCEPNEEPLHILTQVVEDSYTLNETAPEGPIGTFNGFDMESSLDKRIDYVLVRNLRVKSYNNIDLKMANNHFVSDHFPVLITIH